MKTILMSIQPKWIKHILKGDKITEMRKTAPAISKEEFPIKVIWYCTKGEDVLEVDGKLLNGKVVGESIISEIINYKFGIPENKFDAKAKPDYSDLYHELERALLTTYVFSKYSEGWSCKAWRIKETVAYTELKELKDYGIERAPQDWRYLSET